MSEGLVKLVDLSSYWNEVDVPISVIDMDAKTADGHRKLAADSAIQAYVDNDMQVEPGFMYLHINAMGAGEYYGSNKNGDYFPEEQLKKYCKTFETDGYVYRHHINKDPLKSHGKVIFATYNDRMHRVELIAKVSRELGKDIEDNILANMYPQTSMGVKTPYDVCSICSNKAHSRGQYCEHLNGGVNRMLPDGRKVMALNLAPLKFFDISIVLRPADITSSILAKVASEVSHLSVDVADAEGLTAPISKMAMTIKQAAIKKMSELVKEVNGEVTGVAENVRDIMEGIQDPSMELVPTLAQFPISETLNAFAELGMAPSIKFLAELFAYKLVGDRAEGIGEQAEFVTLSMSPANIDIKDAMEILEMEPIEDAPANTVIVNLLRRHSDSSLFDTSLEKRAYAYQGYLQVPYANQLPAYVSMTPAQVEQKRNELAAQQQGSGNLLKTLLALGGAAILSRMYISSLVDSKVEAAKRDIMVAHYLNSRAKIDFEKTAGFASSLIDAITLGYYQLSRATRR